METLEKNGQQSGDQLPDDQLPGLSSLDQIENEAAKHMADGAQPSPGQPGDEQESKQNAADQDKAKAEQEKAFIVTSDVAAAGSKFACKKLKFVFGKKPDNVTDERWEIIKDRAVAVFDQPLFREVVLPVLKKYNITIYNIPPELTMVGGIVYLVIQMREILQNEIAAAQKEQTQN